jgi:hypothetical protein
MAAGSRCGPRINHSDAPREWSECECECECNPTEGAIGVEALEARDGREAVVVGIGRPVVRGGILATGGAGCAGNRERKAGGTERRSERARGLVGVVRLPRTCYLFLGGKKMKRVVRVCSVHDVGWHCASCGVGSPRTKRGKERGEPPSPPALFARRPRPSNYDYGKTVSPSSVSTRQNQGSNELHFFFSHRISGGGGKGVTHLWQRYVWVVRVEGGVVVGPGAHLGLAGVHRGCFAASPTTQPRSPLRFFPPTTC